MKRICTFGILAAALLAGSVALTASRETSSNTPVAVNAATRQAIKAMPILERPNRVGHFYGNTVRRVNDRRPG
jgi:hypothetical protein